MDEQHQQRLLDEGVHALPMFAVESLYYAREVLEAVAVRQGGTLGTDPAELIQAARSKALSTLRQPGKLEHLAARVAERHLRDKILASIPDRESMIASATTLDINVPSPYPAALARIQGLLNSGDLDAIVAGFPVRESGILADIAKALRFVGDVDYEKAALSAISTDKTLAEAVRSKLGALASELQ